MPPSPLVFPEFNEHEFVTHIYDSHANLEGFIAIHRSGPKQISLGATRLWEYESKTDAVRDALRLSRLMSYKAALAGLEYGGAKATLIGTSNALKKRRNLFESYAEKVNYFSGRFVTGTDVGVTEDDVHVMRRVTKYVIGNKVDPAYFTAIGVLNAIRASFHKLYGTESIEGKSFAIQGIGKTGSNVLRLLYKEAGTIFVTDVDTYQLKQVRRKFPRVKVVTPQEIHKQEVDVFIPCALGGILSSSSVSRIKAHAIVGSANNQLIDENVGRLLSKLGILYAPDYVANAGGLVSVVDEFEHSKPNTKRILERIEKIKENLKLIFDESDKKGDPTSEVADRLAEKIFNRQG